MLACANRIVRTGRAQTFVQDDIVLSKDVD